MRQSIRDFCAATLRARGGWDAAVARHADALPGVLRDDVLP